MRRTILISGFLVLILIVSGCMSGNGNSVPATKPHSMIFKGSQNGSNGSAIAIAFKENELSTSSSESKDLFVKGLANLSQYGQYNESLQYFDEALALDQNFTEAWFAKGVAFHNLKSYEEAIGCYNRALALNPQDLGVWYMKGITYQDWGRPADAAECNRKVVELDPLYR